MLRRTSSGTYGEWEFAEPGPTGRLFVGRRGGIPRRRNFNRVWKKALARAPIPPPEGLHLHDLRHTGSTWVAQSGATLKEVMARLGHSSTRAAMVYQHASRERDRPTLVPPRTKIP